MPDEHKDPVKETRELLTEEQLIALERVGWPTKIQRLIKAYTALREQLAQQTIELERESRETQKWNNRANQLAIEGQGLRQQLAQSVSVDVLRRQVDACTELQSQLAQVVKERDDLRDALEPLTQNGRLFTFHRNVKEGDYFECGLCHEESKRWHEIQHRPYCRIQVAKNAVDQVKEKQS